MTAIDYRRKPLPAWWVAFIDAHPVIPTVVAIAGLAAILYALAPAVVRPSGQGQMLDSLATIVKSEAAVGTAAAVRDSYHRHVPADVREYLGRILFFPVLYLVIPFLFALEYLFPCKPSQPLVGKGFLQDAVWFVAMAPTLLLVHGAATQILRGFYDAHFGFLTITSATSWPISAQVIAAVFVGEFLNYLSHFVRHKVGTLWLFHAVHHSQRETNVFTQERIHIFDELASALLMFVPFYMFQVPNLYAVAVIGLYRSIHNRFVHANVKINLGWLGWVIVSPQFHRVHHSVEREHADRNFGGVLSVFDHLFGTAYPDWNIYPETGIDDDLFPIENNVGLLALPGNWFHQTAYPFVQLAENLVPRSLRAWEWRPWAHDTSHRQETYR